MTLHGSWSSWRPAKAGSPIAMLDGNLGDAPIECYSLPAEADGRIGLIGDLSDLKAWECD